MMNADAWLRELTIRAILFDVVSAVVGVLVLYYTVRAAVRDGIKMSGMLDVQRRGASLVGGSERVNRPPEMELPEMRAKR